MIPSTAELREAYEKAPAMVQEFITSPELSAVFTEIRKVHKLHLDESETLSNALNTVFLEIVPFEQFPKLVEGALEQNSDKYDAVLTDVNEKIFTLFRSKLTGEQKDVRPEPNSEQTPIQKQETVLNKEDNEPLIMPDRLEESVRKVPTEIEISQPKEMLGKITEKNANYSAGADPYREPIE